MPTGSRHCVAAAVLATTALSIAAHGVSGQTHHYLPTHTGRFIELPASQIDVDGSFSAAEKVDARRTAALVVALMRGIPLLAQPRGFDVLPRVTVHQVDVDGNSESKRPKVASYFGGFDLANYVDDGKGPVVETSSAAAQLLVTVNDYSGLFSGIGNILDGNGTPGDQNNNEDEQGQFFVDVPEASGAKHGYPVYGDWVVITRKPVPIFLPVTRERYLKVVIKRLDDRVTRAGRNKVANPTGNAALAEALALRDRLLGESNESLADMKQRLTAMSPQERALPAYVDSTDALARMPKFSNSAADAHAVVYFNPALFDPSLPKTAPQMIAVKIVPGEGDLPHIVDQLDDALDWKGLAGLLK
jgi:hypothetical protein